jgi:hypothetical protein
LPLVLDATTEKEKRDEYAKRRVEKEKLRERALLAG